MKLRLFGVMCVVCLMLGVGCGDHQDRVVGGACDRDANCAPEAMCMRGRDYPDGLCTVACNHSGQCPDYSACIEKDGGVCLVTCNVNRDCPVGWKCKDKDLRGQPGKAGVCVGD